MNAAKSRKNIFLSSYCVVIRRQPRHVGRHGKLDWDDADPMPTAAPQRYRARQDPILMQIPKLHAIHLCLCFFVASSLPVP